jgi:hypothetical protein
MSTSFFQALTALTARKGRRGRRGAGKMIVRINPEALRLNFAEI